MRDAATKLGMLFFLFYAGLEVNLSDLKTLGRKAVLIGLIGTVLPIAAGVALVYALPRGFWGPAVQAHFFSFALFVGMNLANSANPVIARILMDLGLLTRPIGALIMSATIVDDLVNWTLFAMILGDIAPSSAAAHRSLAVNAVLVGLLFASVLGLGRRFGPAALRWIQPQVSWPSGFIAVMALLVLLASSASEALGVHAFLGAFLIGAALGDTRDHHKDAHDAIGNFVTSFAPIFFISMGMSANFIANFDALLVAIILVVGLHQQGRRGAPRREGCRDADRSGSLGDRVRPQRPRRDRHHPRRRRPGERAHRCADLRGHGLHGRGHIADGGTDDEPAAGGSGVRGSGQPRGSG